jgi:hypothetical protein
VNHPEAAEWMAFLYEEVAPERKRELNVHLSQCAACAGQVAAWRSGMNVLDEWRLPLVRRAARQPFGAWKWGAAAAVVLGLGFVLGRQTSPRAAELAELKQSVAQLADSVQRDRDAGLSNGVNMATVAANSATLRLLAEYSQLQENQRAADQQTLALAVQNLETRVSRLRAELETVAVNTEGGFEQTHQNLSRLASFSIPVRNETDAFNSEPKQQ